jgi:UDP-N-acetylmuramoyl-L-alanyl-D-glutamate--2,6-diaminopimelate ligase
MKLSELIEKLPFPYHLTRGDVDILGITSDSRLVKPGYLFIAISGGTTDGHSFITNALERGAVAVSGTREMPDLPVPYLMVENSRQVLPHLAAAFYGFPARNLTMVGVTGTDGKTTTTNLIYQILLAAGVKVGMISTINAVIADQVLDTGFHVTTPDAPDVQRYLAQMLTQGVTHAVLEVTSHGLAQYRADACEFDVAVITNITHEHLDYHGSFEVYRAAKARLFEGLGSTLPKSQGNPRKAILNRDDASFDFLSGVTTGSLLTYGFHPEAQIRPAQIENTAQGMRFKLQGFGEEFSVSSHLLGDFNISNCLAAISATVFTLEIPPEAAQEGIASLLSVSGRMERIDLGQDFIALVDFAHTPNALQRALQTARQFSSGRLIAVFGSAGLRDRQKRRMMAETSVELADLTILTAEDPRTEQLDDILAEMAAGALSRGGTEGKTFWRIPDRGNALRFAVSLAQAGDTLITCGKGHEQSMCFGAIEYPWDDRTALRAAISERLSIPGPQMPYLPTQDH